MERQEPAHPNAAINSCASRLTPNGASRNNEQQERCAPQHIIAMATVVELRAAGYQRGRLNEQFDTHVAKHAGFPRPN